MVGQRVGGSSRDRVGVASRGTAGKTDPQGHETVDIHGTPQGGDRLVGDSIAGYVMEESSNDPAAGQGGRSWRETGCGRCPLL